MKSGGHKQFYKARLVTGVLLLPVASIFLFKVDDAHVTMCMIYAITLAVGLLMSLSKKKSVLQSWILSIGAAGVFFYTILTASTLLALEWMVSGSYAGFASVPANMVWWYHFLINFAVLLALLSGRVTARRLWVGFLTAMIAAIAIPGMVALNVRAGYFDPKHAIALYVGFGVVLFLLDLFMHGTFLKDKKKAQEFIDTTAVLVWFYVALSLFIMLWSMV